MSDRVDPAKYDGLIVNRQELSDIFGVSLPTIDRYRSDGMPAKTIGDKGQSYEYDAGECLRWWYGQKDLAAEKEAERQSAIANLQASLDLDGGSGREEFGGNYRVAQEYFDAEIKRNRVEQERGSLRRADEVRAVMEGVFKTLSDSLQSLPDHLERECGLPADAVDDVEQAITRFQGMIVEELRRYLERFPDQQNGVGLSDAA